MDGMWLAARVVAVGVGATLVMDAWIAARQRILGVPAPDYGLVGRWLGHMPRGRFVHERIGATAPIPHERLIGWTAHYATGVAFAALLAGLAGTDWLHRRHSRRRCCSGSPPSPRRSC